MVLANVWAMLRDPELYTDPMEFKPERWLAANHPVLPQNIAFGFGRR